MLQETSDLLKKKMKEKKILHASSLEVDEEDLSKMPKDAKKEEAQCKSINLQAVIVKKPPRAIFFREI